MSQAPADSDDTPANILDGKYEILSELGKGGMGAVYKVRQIFLDEIFAVKLLARDAMFDGVHLRRFQQEAKAARSLDHPNLVKVHDFGVLENDQPFLVMDYVEGPTLADYLKQNGALTVESAKLLCKQLCSGLGHAHAKGIIHRDIKPSNIIVVNPRSFSTKGSIMIVDFGIAKVLADEQNQHQQLTRTGEVFGSPFYMSPEQCLGTTVDQRSDIYSLACVLFEALTGTPPYVGVNALRTMILHESAPIPSLKEASLSKEFPEQIERVISKMLAKSPDDRYATVAEVSDDFNGLGKATIVPTQSTKQTRSVSKVLVATATVLAGIVTLTLIAISMHSPSPTESLKAAPSPIADIVTDFSDGAQKLQAKSKESQLSNWSGRPIVSKEILRNGKSYREFVFPDVPIGAITTELQSDSRNWKSSNTLACGVKDFKSEELLTFSIDFEQFPKGFSHDYKFIGPNEFFGLHLKTSIISDLLTERMSVNQEQFMLDVLKNAKDWHTLRFVFLQHIRLNDLWLQELEQLPQLDNLIIEDPSTDFTTSKHYTFFHKLHGLWLVGTEVEPYTDKIRGSNRLIHLVLTGCAITSKSLDNLLDCSALHELRINQRKLSKNLLDHLVQLEQVRVLKLTETYLSVEEVHNILKKMKLTDLVLQNSLRAKMTAEIKDSRLKFEDKPSQ